MTPAETAFRDFSQHLSRFIARRLGSSADVEDVLQDTFVRIVRNQDKFAEAHTPLAWLYTVTQSVISDHKRKSSRTPSGDDKALAILQTPTPDADTEFNKCLTPLLKTMPEKYSQALEYVDMNGGKQADLARQLGLSAPTIRSRVQRGRRMLQMQISQCCLVQYDAKNNVMDLVADRSGKGACC